MPNLTVSTGPFKNITVIGHDDAASYDQEAGKVGACVEEADYNLIYRGTLPDLHDKATPIIEKLSGVSRGVNEAQTAKAQSRMKEGKTAKPVPESFVDYAQRVKDSVTEEIWTEIDSQFRQLASATKVDASPSARGTGGSLPKGVLEKADSILADDPDRGEARVSKLLAEVPDFDLVRDDEGRPDRTSLGRLVAAFIAKRSEV